MHDPRDILQAMNKILHYFKTSTGRGLLFKRNEKLKIKVYTDADYAVSQIENLPQDMHVLGWIFDDLEK